MNITTDSFPTSKPPSKPPIKPPSKPPIKPPNKPPNKPPLIPVKPKTGGGGNSESDIVILNPETVNHLINDWSMIPSQDNRDIQKMRFLCQRYDANKNFYFGYQPPQNYRRRIRYIFHAEIVTTKKYTIEFTHCVSNPHDISGLPSYPFKKIVIDVFNKSSDENNTPKITPIFDKLMTDARFRLAWNIKVQE